MNIVFMEPLNIEASLFEKLVTPLKEQGHTITSYDNRTTDNDELYERAKDADIITITNNPLPGEVIEKLEKTKYINVAFTGVDHVDLSAAKKKNMTVSNASGYANTAVAELAIGLVQNLYRYITWGDQDIRRANHFSGPFKGRQIEGKTVGIIGTGAIGIETAKLFKAFGANLIGYNRSEKQAAIDLGLTYTDLDTLLKESDIVSVHLPLNDSTRGIIDAAALTLMKKDAIIINVARGPVIDNQALADALNNEEIAGAGIDVFDGEPPLEADYPLLHAKNAILTPHVGFLTNEAMVKRANIAIDNIQAFINQKPKNVVE